MKRIIEKDETNREVIKIHCEKCCCDFETNEYFFLGEDEYNKIYRDWCPNCGELAYSFIKKKEK